MTAELTYWDSDCFLAWFQEEAGKVDACRGPIERAEAGDVFILSSTLTVAEVLWMRGAPRLPEDKASLVRAFFRRPYIRLRNVTRHVAEAAQDLVWNHGIKPKDAIHVATALDAKAVALETFDEKLIKKSGSVGGGNLIIRQPQPPKQGKLL